MTYAVVDEWEGGFGWMQDEPMRRTSHALAVDGRVWLIDPVDDPDLADRVRALGPPAAVLQLLDRHNRGCAAWSNRFGIPVRRAWEGLGDAPFQPVTLSSSRWWSEAALWEPAGRTLVCADALGTVGYFRAPGETAGVHPILRMHPPNALRQFDPERILVGHGPGVMTGAGEALREAFRAPRRKLPAALLAGARSRRT